MEKIATIFSLVAAAATVAAILIAAIVCLAKLIKKAKEKDSDGGITITPEEWKKILISLLPFGVKILEAVSNMGVKEKPSSEQPSQAKAEEIHIKRPETDPDKI